MSNEELAIEIQAGNNSKDYLETLYLQNKGYIAKLAKRLSGYAEMEDLMQQGFIGLYEAAYRYDPAAAQCFITYAAYWMWKSMVGYAYNVGSTIRIPNNKRSQIAKYHRICGEFEREYGRKPSNSEAGYHLKLEQKEVRRLIIDDMAQYIDSIDRPLNDENMTYAEIYADDTDYAQCIVDNITAEHTKKELWDTVKRLEGQQANIISMHYKDRKTIKKIAEECNKTEGEIESIHRKAKAALRQNKYIRRMAKERGFIKSIAYKNSGLQKFKDTWTSSTEFSALKLIDMLPH